MATRQRLTAIVLGACLVGCSRRPTFTTGYLLDHAQLRPQPIAGSLAVGRFSDQRPPRLYTTFGRFFLTYVPLVPYVQMPYERLDESIKIQSDDIAGAIASARVRPDTLVGVESADRLRNRAPPAARDTETLPVAPPFDDYAYSASIARAIADDLGAAGLFERVTYVGDGPADSYAYHLSGILRETPLTKSITSFGLGLAGVALWLIPIPYERTSAAVTVDLVLTDNRTRTVVWRHSLHNQISRLVTLYNSAALSYGASAMGFELVPPPTDSQVDRQSLFSWHFEALRRAMNEAKPGLAAALQSR